MPGSSPPDTLDAAREREAVYYKYWVEGGRPGNDLKAIRWRWAVEQVALLAEQELAAGRDRDRQDYAEWEASA